MKIKGLSTCFITDKVKECSNFYQKFLNAKVTFDCGWYVNIEIGDSQHTLQFMLPQTEGTDFLGKGVTLNFNVEDVDKEHKRLMSQGLKEVMSLDNHPWGDRGFSVFDPIGNALYIYSEREPSEEYKKYYK